MTGLNWTATSNCGELSGMNLKNGLRFRLEDGTETVWFDLVELPTGKTVFPVVKMKDRAELCQAVEDYEQAQMTEPFRREYANLRDSSGDDVGLKVVIKLVPQNGFDKFLIPYVESLTPEFVSAYKTRSSNAEKVLSDKKSIRWYEAGRVFLVNYSWSILKEDGTPSAFGNMFNKQPCVTFEAIVVEHQANKTFGIPQEYKLYFRRCRLNIVEMFHNYYKPEENGYSSSQFYDFGEYYLPWDKAVAAKDQFDNDQRLKKQEF